MAKPQKLKARLPRGLADRSPSDIAATRAMLEKIREVYERYGFDPVETPAIEYTDALGKFLPDQDRPNEGVFSFQDDDEQWLSLRYDLTAPLARYVAENYQNLALPYRSYREGYVFRNEKPGPGRFRQFMQFDADTVGSASMAADAEICMMAADTMEALGFARGEYVVKVNNRKVLDGVMDGAQIPADKRLTVLRAIDKLDRLGIDGVVQLLGKGRKDESGDFTKGAELNSEQIRAIEELLGLQKLAYTPLTDLDYATKIFKTLHREKYKDVPDAEIKKQLSDLRENGRQTLFEGVLALVEQNALVVTSNEKFLEGIRELKAVNEIVQGCGYLSNQIKIDFTVVRGLEYYTGPVYEVELLIDTKDEKGRPVRFGSVGGGGRYDGLVSRFRGEPVPATGFSIGVSRLQAALALIGKQDSQQKFGPVVVTIFDKERIADYQKIVATLRNANIRAELYLGNPKNNLGQQMKYADKRNSPCAIVQGSDEKAKGVVQIKDLIAGANLSEIKDREEYLKRQAESQQECPEDDLVARVREVLARHGVKTA